MKNLSLLFLFFILLSLTFYACVKDETQQVVVVTNKDFVRGTLGKSYYYEVDSIQYDTAKGKTLRDSVRFFLKEVLVDTFLDNTKQKVTRIERYQRAKETQEWQFREVVSEKVEQGNFVTTVDGIVTLQLPQTLAEKKAFDPGIYLEKNFTAVEVKGERVEIYKGVRAKVSSLKATLTQFGKQYDNLCLVEWTNGTDNLAEFRSAKEYYAKGIGLIYRELRALDTQCLASCATQSWDKKAQSGFVWRMKLKEVK